MKKPPNGKPRYRHRDGWLAESPLLKARLAAKLTQRQLATLAGTSDTTVRALEQGSPRRSKLVERMGKALRRPGLANAYMAWLSHRPHLAADLGSITKGKQQARDAVILATE